MEEQKKDECCNAPAKKGCGCCCGVNKVVAKVLLVVLIFACGYLFAKGSCPSSSQMCPIIKK
jgi:hypothetical protein